MKIVRDNENELVGANGKLDSRPVYNPAKQYTWTPEDVFLITGDQFGMMLNAFRTILSSPEATQILMAQKANNAIEAIIAKGVQDGVVKEVLPK